jgi:hypothetical protein
MDNTKKKTAQKPVKDNGQGLKVCLAQFRADEKACDDTYPEGGKPDLRGICHQAANDAHVSCIRGTLGAPTGGTTKA